MAQSNSCRSESGATILFGFIVSVNQCKFTVRIHFFPSPLWPDSIGDQRVTKERDGDWRLETDH